MLLTLLVLRARRLSSEKMADWLGRYDALAVAAGMDPSRTVSAARLSRRSRHLGPWPCCFFFVGLALPWVRLGAVTGRQVLRDGSLLKAWFHRDPDADLAGRRHGPPTYTFQIHALVGRGTHLPLLLAITPASWAEVTVAPFLPVSPILLDGLRVGVLDADAASSASRFVALVRLLGIIPIIDHQLRRLGKRFLATPFFRDPWRRLRAPRSAVGRRFAFPKRSYGPEYFPVRGGEAAWRYALLAHAAMRAVAPIAHRRDRPDPMTRRSRVLAFATD